MQKGLFWILGLGTQNKIRYDPTEALLSSKGWVHTPSLPSRGSMAVVKSVGPSVFPFLRLSGRPRGKVFISSAVERDGCGQISKETVLPGALSRQVVVRIKEVSVKIRFT